MSNKGIKCKKEKSIAACWGSSGIIQREWKGFSVVMTGNATSF